VCCVYSLVTSVSEWLPKWDFTLLHWSHLPERSESRFDGTTLPFLIRSSLSSLSLSSLFPRATSIEDHPTRYIVRSVMPTSSGSYARTTGLRSNRPVDEQPSASAGPVQPILSRVHQSGFPLPPTVPSGSSGPWPVPQPMTVLPIPVLRVAPDATETTPPKCDSPAALQSAPAIALAEVVEDIVAPGLRGSLWGNSGKRMNSRRRDCIGEARVR
jgi:hypothetical protein